MHPMNKKFDFDDADDCSRLRRLFEILGLSDVDSTGGGAAAYEGIYGTLVAQGRNPLTAEDGPFSLLLLVNESDAGLTVQICGDWDWLPLQVFAEGQLTLVQIAAGMSEAVSHFSQFRHIIWEPMIAKAIEEATAESTMDFSAPDWNHGGSTDTALEMTLGCYVYKVGGDPEKWAAEVRLDSALLSQATADDGETAKKVCGLGLAEILSKVTGSPIRLSIGGKEAN